LIVCHSFPISNSALRLHQTLFFLTFEIHFAVLIVCHSRFKEPIRQQFFFSSSFFAANATNLPFFSSSYFKLAEKTLLLDPIPEPMEQISILHRQSLNHLSDSARFLIALNFVFSSSRWNANCRILCTGGRQRHHRALEAEDPGQGGHSPRSAAVHLCRPGA
jgi:hypothetical protein